MIAAVTEYLLLYGQFPLQGFGGLSRERVAAVMDIPGRQIYPPGHRIHFSNKEQLSADGFIQWYSAKQATDQVQARNSYDRLLAEWKQFLDAGSTVVWNGIGTWTVNEQKSIVFEADKKEAALNIPVPAEKVVREHAGHTVRVGEEHRSSEEMTQLLSKKKKTVSYEFWISVALLVLAICFWIWQLWGRPLVPSGFANPRKVMATLFIHHSSLL